jgi:hypothetical protein
MDSLKEIWESLSERFKNPLFYSFVISWAVLNYKVLVVLFDNAKYTDKFDYIEKTLYSVDKEPWFPLVIYPLIFAAIYVFFLPCLSLLSTWTNAIYDRLNSDIRARELKKALLTKDQRDLLEEKVAVLVNDLRDETHRAKDAQDFCIRQMGLRLNEIFKVLLPYRFLQLRDEALQWSDDYVKKPPGPHRTISGTVEQKDFVAEYGIPKLWVKVFEVINGPLGVDKVSRELNLSVQDALEILIALSALNMLQPVWLNDDLKFTEIESSWIPLLSGREPGAE